MKKVTFPKVTLPVDPNPPDMQALAQQTAADVKARIGVDGVFVLIVRATDDSMGCGLLAPEIPFDVIAGCAIQMLGALRAKLHAAHVASTKEPT